MVPSKTRGTMPYFKLTTWRNINKRTVNGKYPHLKNPSCVRYINLGVEIRMTKDDFYAWCDTQSELIMGIYEQNETPSIDRLGGLHYEFGNIRILSKTDNDRFAREKKYANSIQQT